MVNVAHKNLLLVVLFGLFLGQPGLVRAQAGTSSLDSPRYSRGFGSHFVVVTRDFDLLVYRHGRTVFQQDNLSDLIALDYANLAGGAEPELILIAADGISYIDLEASEYRRVSYSQNPTPFTSTALQNRPKTVRLFYEVSDQSAAVPLWFDHAGLMTMEDNRPRRLTQETMPSYLDGLGAQLTMPGVQSITSVMPLVSVQDVNQDGQDEIFYINNSILHILTYQGQSLGRVDLSGYHGTTAPIFWDRPPVAFIDVNNDGLEDLHLFSFSPKQGSTSGEVELTALVFFRQETPGRSSNDLSFSSFPNRRYGILASNFPNGVSTLRDLNGDGIPDIEFTSIDLTASITNLLLRRSIAVSYKPILYNRYTHRYEDTGLELGNTLSIDQPRASQTQAGSALESLAGLNFTQMIGRIFPRFDAPSGVSARPRPQASASSPLLFMYNGQGRQLSYFRLPNLRNGQGLQTPSFLRVTDQPELIMTGDVLEVYLIRNGRMYYQRIPL